MDETRSADREEWDGSRESGVEAVAREELRRVVADLAALSFRLVGVAAILPRVRRAGDAEAEEEETESALDDLRTAIACALFDHLDAALGVLRQALDPMRTGGEAPSSER